jgi:hypothetical protein
MPISRRGSRPSGRKNAHRGSRRSPATASRPTHSQVLIASEKNRLCSTISRQMRVLQSQTYVCGPCVPEQSQTVVNNWLTGNYGADPQTGQTIAGNDSGSMSDTDIMKSGTELFSRVGTVVSVGLDVYQAVNSTSVQGVVFHSVDAIVDVGVSRLGYVGFGISVLWTLSGGAQGIYQMPNRNPSFVFPY